VGTTRLFIGTLGIKRVPETRRLVDSVVGSVETVRCCYIDNGSSCESWGTIHSWRINNPSIDEFLSPTQEKVRTRPLTRSL
jgi:hypothetical protein